MNFCSKPTGTTMPVEAKIEKVKDKLRKRARDEITPIPTI